MSFRRALLALTTAVILSLLPGLPVQAACEQPSTSTSYFISECQFGIGGEPDLNSTSYNANASLGSLGVGVGASTNYTSQAGFLTPREEYLEMGVNAATINLGTLTTSAAATGNATFFVRAYTSSGYTVQTISGTPTNGGESLDPITSAAVSSPGTEQFGINLVANTSPTTYGADPVKQPSSGYAYGEAASGYDTTNLFQYNQGDTIVTSPKGIGQTDFTISYLANISPISPGGEYSVEHILVVIATF
jgi:hypothetical protein